MEEIGPWVPYLDATTRDVIGPAVTTSCACVLLTKLKRSMTGHFWLRVMSARAMRSTRLKPEESRPSRLTALVFAIESPRLALPATSRSRGTETCVVTVRAGLVPEAGMFTVTGNCMFAPKTCAGVMNCVPEKYRSDA